MSDKVNLGMFVHDFNNGGFTENISLSNLKGNLLISGGDRSERTALLSHVLNQFHTDFPDIGVLMIQVGSNEDTHLFHLDKVYEYGDPELVVPYFIGEKFTGASRDQFTRCINAIFGFHYEMRIVLSILCRHYRSGRLPGSIVHFLEDLKDSLIENPYSEEFTESNVRSFEKAIEIFEEDPILERTLSIPLKTPEWLRLWSNGGKISINLSNCGIHHQKLLVPIILQAIKNYVDFNESSIPSGIVVIEGADYLLERPPHDEYKENYRINGEYSREIKEENYFLTKEQIEEVFEDKNYLMNVQLEEVYYHLIGDEFRYRNIALITVCEDPANIYDFISFRSQIKLQVG